ncbi:unnamed protein product [Cyclocybe aegerita]|uniref:Uncharacterized protein n=1 Tax=Cyclocybe aegerita TaxID=1973307 RepID=A0A8S0WXB4_CYCAE|nr:unnamed protein product [Cyclocybe aegerita]
MVKPQYLDSYREFLELISQRARARPLKLQVLDLHPAHTFAPAWSSNLLKMLSGFFARCKFIGLFIQSRTWYDRLLQLDVDDSTFEDLEKLSLFIKHDHIDDTQPAYTVSLPFNKF